ncbi:nucleotidyltransferase domain-containing protein [Streptomyces sp. NPDC085479]|uniref:nucleotidyltransferase domain-containing protein n=1 Tax=Streptomyces sp. NPDC085479 TaxID=3365726 RepID=UPI0037CDA9EF
MREQQPGRDWDPADLAEVVTLFSKTPRPWWVAGGYAVELAVGRPFREHDDIDVLLLRQDQLAVQEVLAGWEWWAADPPSSLRRWLSGEVLPVGVHDVWCWRGPASPGRIQVLLAPDARDPLARQSPLPGGTDEHCSSAWKNGCAREPSRCHVVTHEPGAENPSCTRWSYCRPPARDTAAGSGSGTERWAWADVVGPLPELVPGPERRPEWWEAGGGDRW